jgi:hypothetical protein
MLIVANMFALALVRAASAVTITDKTLPVLVAGEKTYHVYSVPYVVGFNGLTTVFSCTSMEPTATIQVGVQTFGATGGDSNDPVGTSLSLFPGGTRTLATGTALGFSVDSVIGGGGSKGSARILATSKKIACTAFVADASNVPPTSAWQLTIVKQTKQKGD